MIVLYIVLLIKSPCLQCLPACRGLLTQTTVIARLPSHPHCACKSYKLAAGSRA